MFNPKKIKTIIYLVASILIINISIVSATPTCVFVKFSDISGYSNLDTSELFSDIIIEKIINNNLFLVKESKIPYDDMKMMYIDNYDEMNILQEGESRGNFNALFDEAKFGIKPSKIYENVQGDVVYPDIINNISLSNNVSYIIHGTVKHAVGYDVSQEAEMTFHKFALNIIGANEKRIEVKVHLIIIDGKTGKVVWRNDVKGKGEKLNIKVSDFTFGGKHYDSAMYYNAVNNAAEIIVDNIKAAIESGNLVLENRGE